MFHSKRRLLRTFDVAGNSKTHFGLRPNCPIFLPDFNQICVFSSDFYKGLQQNLMEMLSAAVMLIYADRRTGSLSAFQAKKARL
jgi:hypothetical protein